MFAYTINLRIHMWRLYNSLRTRMCEFLCIPHGYTNTQMHSVCMCARVCACVGLKGACLGGLTGKLGLNLNAGHFAAFRFRFCLPVLLCTQDGNPFNMARIPIKFDNRPPPLLRFEPVHFEWTKLHPVILQSTSSHTLMCCRGCGLKLFCQFAQGQNWQGH